MKVFAKYAVYCMLVIRRLMTPSCPYKIRPRPLSAFFELIEATRERVAAVIESGVGWMGVGSKDPLFTKPEA